MTIHRSDEIWKTVPSLDNQYSVSNFGNVRSEDRTVTNTLGRVYKIKGKIRKKSINNMGYEYVHVSIGGVSSKVFVHRMVGECFLEKPEGCDVINHIDGNPLNNDAENLEWVTQKYNCWHRHHVLGNPFPKPSPKGGKSWIAKPVCRFSLDGYFEKYYGYMDAVTADGYPSTSVSKCLSGSRNKAGNKKWFSAKDYKLAKIRDKCLGKAVNEFLTNGDFSTDDDEMFISIVHRANDIFKTVKVFN